MPMRFLAVPLLVFHSRAQSIQALQRDYFSRSIHRQTKAPALHFDAQSCRMQAASEQQNHEPEDFDDRPSSSPSLLEIFSPAAGCKVEQMSSTDLAYVGDALYELTVRSWAVWPPKRTSDLQNQVVELVRGELTPKRSAPVTIMPNPSTFYLFFSFVQAEHQADLLGQLKADPAFGCTLAELQVLARGRNSVSGSSRNRRNPSAYQDATALEALIGYLFITDRDRCKTLLGWIRNRLHGTSP